MSDIFIIAIDGPAASGKGTLGRRLSQELALPHLDTGLTYRAVAHELLRGDLPLDDESVAVEAALRVDLAKLDRATLSDHAVGNAASKVAAMPAVRRTLVELQRDFAASPPGAVLDGRDIGTVVCPDADVKLYVTASPEERAKRRWKEMQDKGQDADYQEILDDIAARDARDMGREDSPLRPADDAHLLDTSQMDIETAFQRAMTFVEMVKSR
ncbi:MAG: (d)CMP kinase [Hyphomicrobiales bacterium]|nr:(d)CMP kinase [Hyphomicrobiales bacterium]